MSKSSTIAITTMYVDLVLDSGELVRIEYRTSDQDALFDSLEFTMKRKDWWSPNQFEGCKAEFLGMRMDRVSMARVVGML